MRAGKPPANPPHQQPKWSLALWVGVIATAVIIVSLSVLAVLGWQAADRDERRQAHLAFRSVADQQANVLQSFLLNQLRIGRVLAAGVASHNGTVSREAWDTIVRPHADQLLGGGAVVVERIPNTTAAVAAFEARVSARYGFPVSVYFSGSASDGQDFLFPMVNAFSHGLLPLLSLDYGSIPTRRALVNGVTQEVPFAITGLLDLLSSGLSSGFAVYTSVFPDEDPNKFGVASGADMRLLVLDSAKVSRSLVLVTDPAGTPLHAAGCSDSNPDGTGGALNTDFTASYTLTVPNQTAWSLHLTACSEVVDDFSTSRRWELLAAVLAVAAAMALGVAATGLAIRRTSEANAQSARLTAAEQAHGMLVGHLAHELRNPLHVLKTWFPVLATVFTSAATTSSASSSVSLSSSSTSAAGGSRRRGDSSSATAPGQGSGCDSAPSPTPAPPQSPMSTGNRVGGGHAAGGDAADAAAVVRDVRDALDFMTHTVNDVLDFRQLSAGSFHTVQEPHDVHTFITGTMARCVAYLPDGVSAVTRIATQSPVASFAAVRLGQILTNGMSNAGKAGSTAVRLDVAVLDDQWLVFDLQNRGSGLPPDTQALFVPFQSRGLKRSEWAPGGAPAVWREAMTRLHQRLPLAVSPVLPEPVPVPERLVRHAVQHSTGLGLPLSRAFAKCAGGWLDLYDGSDGWTHFWGVVHVTPATPAAASASSPADVQVHVDTDVPSPLQSPTAGIAPSTAGCGAGFGSSHSMASVTHATHGAGSDRLLSLPPSPNTATPDVSWSSLRVAVVDDEAANRRIIQKFLLQLGVPRANIMMAPDATAGALLLSDATIDAMFLDNSMPGITGVQMMLAATHDVPFPVVAATGSVDAEACRQYEAAGMVGVVCKPFKVDQVKTALQLALGGSDAFFTLQSR